jgi:hypothetical protein
MSNGPWIYSNDGITRYSETEDPRVVLVVKLDDEMRAPDYESAAPGYWLDGTPYGNMTLDYAGGYRADDEAEAYVSARYRLNQETTDRYMRVFHDTAVAYYDGPTRGERLVVLDTPAWRAEMGFEGEEPGYNYGDWSEFAAGEVYGSGYAVYPERVTDETPIDLEDGNWNVELTWGFYGEEWAMEASGDRIGEANLPTLLF